MRTYFHISNTNCNWTVGDEIQIGKEDNNYWTSFMEKNEMIELQEEKHDAYKVVNAAFEHYAGIRPAPQKMIDYHFNILQSLKETLECLGNTIKINREIIFESVRKEFHPKLPSRKTCIWLIPDKQSALDFWIDILYKGKGQKIFQVEIMDGLLHRASQDWLIGGTFSINEWINLAHNYWKGLKSGKKEDEVLYEGAMKIVKEITLPNSV